MKYKVGDRVRIKSLDWYNENKNRCGEIPLFNPSGLFVPDMSRHCNNIMTIKDICYGTCYRMKEDVWNYNWTDEMIERLVEEEMSLDKAGQITDFEYEGLTYTLPDGYQFVDENGNVINATKIVLEKKKKEYPKIYEECYKIMGVKLSDCYIQGYKSPLLEDLQELLICRDAYWKIVGEKMGFGKPWEPRWNDGNQKKYIIYNDSGDIKKGGWFFTNAILAFPTEEMRDAFYENFKEIIEQCKELL